MSKGIRDNMMEKGELHTNNTTWSGFAAWLACQARSASATRHPSVFLCVAPSGGSTAARRKLFFFFACVSVTCLPMILAAVYFVSCWIPTMDMGNTKESRRGHRAVTVDGEWREGRMIPLLGLN